MNLQLVMGTSVVLALSLMVQQTSCSQEVIQNNPNHLGNTSQLVLHRTRRQAQYCNSNADCSVRFGYSSRCYNHVCICDIGYYPSSTGYCTKINCQYDVDCSSRQYYTQCYGGTCRCATGTYLDIASQTCLVQPKSTTRRPPTSQCFGNSDCTRYYGTNSRCFAGYCICDLGYYPMTNNGYCSKINCNYDVDCYSRQALTKCSRGTCVCASGTKLEKSSQTCRNGAFSMVGSGAVMLVLALLSVSLARF